MSVSCPLVDGLPLPEEWVIWVAPHSSLEAFPERVTPRENSPVHSAWAVPVLDRNDILCPICRFVMLCRVKYCIAKFISKSPVAVLIHIISDIFCQLIKPEIIR